MTQNQDPAAEAEEIHALQGVVSIPADFAITPWGVGWTR
jgi:hypothetical protein